MHMVAPRRWNRRYINKLHEGMRLLADPINITIFFNDGETLFEHILHLYFLPSSCSPLPDLFPRFPTACQAGSLLAYFGRRKDVSKFLLLLIPLQAN